jgi:hypothetical protein
MLNTLEGMLDPDGTIRFREKFRLSKSRRVLVTILEEEDTPQEDAAERTKRLQALLAAPRFRERPYGEPGELEALVAHNRTAWDE